MTEPNAYAELLISSIYYDTEFNCRSEFLPQSCLELAESIRRHGLLFPVVVQPMEDVAGYDHTPFPTDREFRLLVGHRRFTAVSQLLAWGTIPCRIMSGLTEKQAKVLNVLENVERKNLNMWEEAKALQGIFPSGAPYKEMALEMSKGREWCRVRWGLLSLPEHLQKDCAAGRLQPTDIALIIAVEGNEEQIAMASRIKRAKASGQSARRRRAQFGKVKRARTRVDIQVMLSTLMTDEIKASPYRALAWASGELTDNEFLESPL